MATLTGEQFEAKLRSFTKRQPAAVRKALKTGSNDLRSEVQRRYKARLKVRTGRLYKAIKVLGVTANGDTIRASVGVEPKQVYKGATLEEGGTHRFKGGQPFLAVGGSGVWFVSRKSALASMLPKTQPYSIRIPARPFVQPAQDAKLADIKQGILDELMEAYRRA